MAYFGDVVPFLRSAHGISPAPVAQLIANVDDEDDTTRRRLELAAMIDIGKHLVWATNKFEGDGLFVFSVYSTLQGVASAFSVVHCPNLAAVASDIAGGDPAQATILEADMIHKARPAISWFIQKFNVAFRSTVMAFKDAQIFDPVYAQATAVNLDKVEALRCFPCLDDDATIQDLLTKLLLYVAAIDGVEIEEDNNCINNYFPVRRTASADKFCASQGVENLFIYTSNWCSIMPCNFLVDHKFCPEKARTNRFW